MGCFAVFQNCVTFFLVSSSVERIFYSKRTALKIMMFWKECNFNWFFRSFPFFTCLFLFFVTNHWSYVLIMNRVSYSEFPFIDKFIQWLWHVFGYSHLFSHRGPFQCFFFSQICSKYVIALLQNHISTKIIGILWLLPTFAQCS